MNIEQDELTYWEIVAKTKWGNYVCEIEKETVIKANALSKRRTNLLDMGSGGGRWAQLLLNMGWTDIICIDVNPKDLNICSRRIPEALCVLADPEAHLIPAKKESIDLLLCIEVQPVVNSEWFIEEAFRVLRSGGILLTTLHNKFSYRSILHRAGVIRSHEKKNTYYKISYNALRRNLSQTGFNIIYEKGFCWPPFSRTSDSGLVPLFTKAEKRLGLMHVPKISPWVIFLAQKP
jgi:ubiquinone/menaquinone biosynthesis C-methylase UbiE